ncbi:MAG: GspE/PulE family protein [Candidatus Buchananbacteria bacterium]|nr:GspE/PulE family protein [Candidatus Buchananbacteria bacterium]
MPIGPSLEDLLPKPKDGEGDGDEKAYELQEKIKEITIKDKEGETEKTAASLGLPYINLIGFGTGPEALATIPKDQSKELKVICFFNDGKEIRLGAVDITEEIKKLAEELKEKHHAHTVIYLISQNSFDHTFKLYDALPEIRKFIKGIEITEAEIDKFEKEIKTFKDLDERIKKSSITELVTLIIAGAIKSRASDIHIEAEEKDIKIRYRIDGVLNDAAIIEKDIWPKIASRLKQLAKLKINVVDRPQDGRFSIFLKDNRIDVRVSALPTGFGESIVIRLLMASAVGLSFEELGIRGRQFKILEREIQRPNGMIVTTGPTGSGKTTTLYAVLKKLNSTETKIITIEDPIEYELGGINQSQVTTDYTFSKGLRSIVRQDPDIIMVGEIRDLETAEISIQAALTGHLVLSTIHTNDAFGAIPRFLALGAKPFLLAPALNVAIGQRLVRKICEKCKTETELDKESLDRVKTLLTALPAEEKKEYKVDLDKLKFYKGQGCEVCQGLGYKGRIGIYEIMPIEGEIEDAISKGTMSENDIREIAKKIGIVSMVQDGILKALEGITSVEEVFRVAE